MNRKGNGMKVFVAGGGGALGARLLSQLLAADHEVIATASSPQGVAAIERLGVAATRMDGLDRESVVAAVGRAEPDVVVHEMTALNRGEDLRHFDRWFALTNKLRTTGTENLLAACGRAGVGRLVAQSYTGWTNERSGGPVKTEEDPLDPDPPAAMRESLAAIRTLERTVSMAALAGVVLRYGSLCGPGTAMESTYVEVVRKRRLPIIGDGGGIWSFLHVDDAARATVAAVEGGPPGIYNIVDDEPVAAAEWLPVLAERSGAKPPRRVPTWIGRLAAGEVGVSMMTRIRGSSNAKARRELGWRPLHVWREALGPQAPAGGPALRR
jgi:nucleoside-diphosphate-sugar epimerase